MDLDAAPLAVALADVNADGAEDVVASSSGAIVVRLGHGDGTFEPAVLADPGPIPAYLGVPSLVRPALVATDLNGDGRPDVAITRPAGDVSVLRSGA